jgi:hypothetical protein
MSYLARGPSLLGIDSQANAARRRRADAPMLDYRCSTGGAPHELPDRGAAHGSPEEQAMKPKSAKPIKRAAGAAAPRRSANARAVRTVRGDDLGDRRLQLLLGTKLPAR